MDFHGFPWTRPYSFPGIAWLAFPQISMDFYRFPWFSWICMDSHGFSWISMDFHGFPWVFMDFHGFPWIFPGYPGCAPLPHGARK